MKKQHEHMNYLYNLDKQAKNDRRQMIYQGKPEDQPRNLNGQIKYNQAIKKKGTYAMYSESKSARKR